MGDNRSDQQPETVEGAPVLPDLDPWREVGWIFRDGDCIAIERQAEVPDPRVLVD
ncbi:MAG TPA: hypothetical protein VHX67_09990 [Acidimicrobiales bacterium]|jgi:hypothetical protein|nr:hypothetical protein [Acidimicrobiales bacterium]